MALFGGGGSSDEMKIKVSLDVQDANQQVQQLNQSLGGLGTGQASAGLDGFGQSIANTIAGSLTLTAAMAGLNSVLGNAQRVEQLSAGFDTLQQRIGSDSVQAMNGLKAATSGLISEMDLMQSANQAVLLGVDDGSGKFQKLSAAALKLGAAMGITAKEALDSLVVGIGRGSKLVLDNLGIIVNTEKAYKDFAATIGTTADKLSDAQQKLAFQKAAFEAVSKSAGDLAEPADTAATAFLKLKNAAKDLYDQTTRNISEDATLRNGIELTTSAIQNAPTAWSTLSGWIETLSDKYNDLTGAAKEFLFLQGAKELAAWSVGFFNYSGQAEIAAQKLKQLKNEQLEFLRSSRAGSDEALKFSSNLTAISTEAAGAAESVRDLRKAQLAGASVSSLKLDTELKLTGDNANFADTAFKGLNASLKDYKVQGGGAADTSDKVKKKLYELADIGKELSQKILGQDLTQIVEELGQGFGDGAIKADQLTKILENSRDAFIKLGLSAQQADSIIKGIKLTPTPTPNKPGGTTGGTPNLLGDLFSGIFGTPVAAGGSSGTADTAAATFAANLGLQVQNKLSDGIVAAFEGNDIGNSIKGLAGSLASAVATSFGGPIAGSLAQVGVSVAGSIIDQVSAGKQISGADQTKAALLTGGMSLFATAGYNAIIGGSKSPEEEARKQIENFLESTLGENVIFGNFQDNFADSFSNITGNAQSSFTAIGDIIRSLTGVSEEVGAQIGYILADNFGGTIDDLKYLVSDLGLTFEQVQDQMVQAFLAGDQTAQEVISTLAGLEEAFKPGLEGAGQFTKAMDNLIASMGTGKESLKSLKDLAVEFKETGGKTLGEFQNALEASGKYTSAQIQQLFQALSQRGITSLDQLAGASDLALIGIIADLQTLGFKFADSIGGGVKDSIDDINKLRDTISKLPETVEKNIKINVSTNYSDSQAKGALAQLTGNSSPGIARQ